MFFNLFIKYFILLNLLILTMFSMFTNDLMNIWLIMEINNFLFISYFSFSIKNKKMIFFYYIIQIIPSMILILSISLNNMNLLNKNILNILIYLSLMIKLGVPPFHFWMPLISIYFNWNELFFLITFQKIIPFYMLSMINLKSYFILFSIILCAIIPPFMMMNLMNLKKLLTYSSINQLGWMILLIYLKNIIWFYYLIMYSLITMMIFYILSYKKFYYNYINNSNIYYNMIILMIMMNMASIPPFSFFMFKWFSIFIIIFNSNLFIASLIMIISSFLMFFIYMNMIYLIMFNNLIKSKLMNLNILNFNYMNMILFIMMLFFSLFMFIM
uniref:NADH dehydrogenase subunit 2 n=1 Tax=Tapinoma ibericum TaxID=2005328 RepID=UPI002176ED02|nr:NADH dehydrogenase subunit 2 [Tapinoma ibericum]UUF93592.1 NADH dehydrogenase subunit 2 [Tapinoma ibericum]